MAGKRNKKKREKKQRQNVDFKVGQPTRVCAVMSFEMRTLCVSFAAAHVVAGVRGDPLPRPGATPAFGLRLLGQTVSTGDHEGFCAAQAERTFRSVTLGNQVCKSAVGCSYVEESQMSVKGDILSDNKDCRNLNQKGILKCFLKCSK